MAAYTRAHGLALRPHTKTHKSPRIAQEQVHRGAIGLTCATPLEAEVMASVSQDLLLAYPPVGEARLRRLMALPDHVRLTVALDSRESADQLARAAAERGRNTGVYVEVDLGMHRVGMVRAEEVVKLIGFVSERPSLSYRGIAFYPGHIRSLSAGEDELHRLASDLQNTIRILENAGLSPAVVSGGSTPTVWESHRIPGLTEIRPGTYVYNDRITALAGACDWNDCALTVLATVVSTAVPGQAVVDAGSKSLGREPSGSVESGFGSLLDRPEVVVAKLSEEHGILDLRGTRWRPAVGDRVRIIPNHVCIAVHLHEVIYGVRGEQIQTSWPVAARGRLQADRIPL
jgi:D-serine deaminase-like pyridoxal phosphate-dependent protein